MRTALLSLLLAVHLTAAADRTAIALEEAIKKETVEGDLKAAIAAYEEIARGSDRALAVRALLRMAGCYEKLNDPRAAKAYEQVIARFADRTLAVEEARRRLAALAGSAASAGTIGWYNGDWQSGIPSPANWFVSKSNYVRVYEDFVVPAGGWTVVAVFANHNLYEFPPVTHASWEIRSGMAPGHGGKVVAFGLDPAVQAGCIRQPDSGATCRIEVAGIRVPLPPGRYWLSVAPVGSGKSYVSSTVGKNAKGEPAGTNGGAFFDGPEISFAPLQAVMQPGQRGTCKDVSMGVRIASR